MARTWSSLFLSTYKIIENNNSRAAVCKIFFCTSEAVVIVGRRRWCGMLFPEGAKAFSLGPGSLLGAPSPTECAILSNIRNTARHFVLLKCFAVFPKCFVCAAVCHAFPGDGRPVAIDYAWVVCAVVSVSFASSRIWYLLFWLLYSGTMAFIFRTMARSLNVSASS